MSDDLRAWIDYLHAAAAVPQDAPDYEEAQQAVEEALLHIRGLNRRDNAQDQADLAHDVPGAGPTMAANALKEGGRMAGSAALGGLAAMGGPVAWMPRDLKHPFESSPIAMAMRLGEGAGGEAAGYVASAGSPEALEEASAQHPFATVAGEMTPSILGAMSGGPRAISRLRASGGKTSIGQMGAMERAARKPFQGSQQLEGVGQFAGPPVRTSKVDMRPSLPAAKDPMDTPTFQRRDNYQPREPHAPSSDVPAATPATGKSGAWSSRQVGVHPKPNPDMVAKQTSVLQQHLAGVDPADIPAKLEEMRSLGIQIPANALEMLGLKP